MDEVTVEVCIDSVESALESQRGGADRVELCDNLIEGGTTPSAGTIEVARSRIDIRLHVIVRPRGGDFLYSADEHEVMKRDVLVAKQLGADGVVFGMLTEDGAVDRDRTRELVELARPMAVTFHRAIDVTRDPFEALDALAELGVDRVLTTGQEDVVWDGLDLIARLVEHAGDRIGVMAGGGSNLNVKAIVERTGVEEVHVVGTRTVESRMRYRNTRCFMGGVLRPPEYATTVADSSRIRSMVDQLAER